VKLLEVMIAHPRAVVTMEAFAATDHGNYDSTISLLTSHMPQVLVEGLAPRLSDCVWGIWSSFNRIEALGSLFNSNMLMAVKRTKSAQVAGRLSDVLREVLSDYARFAVDLAEKPRRDHVFMLEAQTVIGMSADMSFHWCIDCISSNARACFATPTCLNSKC
jgi:hypothetical protein